MNPEGFVTRHSIKFKEGRGLTESKDYPGLTAEGVELGQKTSREVLKPMIDKMSENAVVALIGASDAIRTKSTSKVYGDTLKELYQHDKSVVVKNLSITSGKIN
jgi:hypothetical protein